MNHADNTKRAGEILFAAIMADDRATDALLRGLSIQAKRRARAARNAKRSASRGDK